MSNPATPARALDQALRTYARPWRLRRAREAGIAVAALASALGAACLAVTTPIALLICVGGATAAAFFGVSMRRRMCRTKWREVEAHLGSDGALQAAIENASSWPLGQMAARHFAVRLQTEVPPQQLAVRPGAWVSLALALLLLTIATGVVAESAVSFARPSEMQQRLALEALDAADAARDSASGATRSAEASAAVRELRERHAQGLLSNEEFAKRMQQISKNFARRPAESTIPASSQRVSGSSTSSFASSGGTSESTTDFEQSGVARSDTLSHAAKSWDELPERYRRHVARYFRRLD